MPNRCLLSCPDVNMQHDIRVKTLACTVTGWIHSDAFTELIELFGGNTVKSGHLKEQIDYYNRFAEVWDYRKKKANGGERWMIQEDTFLSEHRTTIMDCMTILGLRDVVEPTGQPDYILPLGGARMANLDRCETAKEVCAKYPESDIPVFALTGMRPINDIERASLAQYAPNAQTEYEAMCGGMTKAFNLSEDFYEEEIHEDENINLAWAERHYNDDLRRIHILSAPSSNPEKRANSMDTFKFFMERYKVEPGARILLVTSCIYVPFQLLKFTELSLAKGIYVDCIGNKSKPGSPSVLNAASYLQELKATINAVYSLSERYF